MGAILAAMFVFVFVYFLLANEIKHKNTHSGPLPPFFSPILFPFANFILAFLFISQNKLSGDKMGEKVEEEIVCNRW